MKACFSVLGVLLGLVSLTAAHGQDARPFNDNAVVIIRNCPGVRINRQCIENPTPAQREEAGREIARNNQKAVEQRQAEEARKQAVAAETKRLGEHRRAEAERAVAMREAAEAARRKQDEETYRKRIEALSPADRAAYELCAKIAADPKATANCG